MSELKTHPTAHARHASSLNRRRHWLSGRLVDCLPGRLVDWSTGRLVDWLTGRFVGWLAGWLVDWLTGRRCSCLVLTLLFEAREKVGGQCLASSHLLGP